VFGVAAGLLGLSGTKAALPVYWGWMAIAFVMGNIVSRILVFLIYYGLLMPMGLMMRAVGRDKLVLRKPDADSYWRPVKPDRLQASHEHMF
jgi:hypothetical protein